MIYWITKQLLMWFVKSKRAQTSDDDETWLRGGVVPTLNAFDMGDTRATVVIVMREREGKAGGGKGFLLAENRSFTLATSNFQIIFYGQRVGDVRVQDDKINTLQARMGTGGNNMPMVAEIFPIQGTVIGRSDEAGPQGKGFANDGEPMFTLDRVSGHGVAMAFDTFNQTVSDTSQTIKSHSANNENIGTVLIPNEPMAVDIYNASIDKDVTHTLKAANQPMGVPSVMTSTVRRLTPTECERLQGFPDGWTEGQADSHRYKQMGNAVAVPVVQWIINRLTN